MARPCKPLTGLRRFVGRWFAVSVTRPRPGRSSELSDEVYCDWIFEVDVFGRTFVLQRLARESW